MATATTTRKPRRKPSAAQKLAAAQKRAYLISLSKQVKAAMEMGRFQDCERVNEALVQVYQDQTGQEVFKTFAGWKEEGKSVKKGEKSFLIWGKPRKMSAKVENEDGTEDEKKFKRFPVCYLFHAGQVETAAQRANARELAK